MSTSARRVGLRSSAGGRGRSRSRLGLAAAACLLAAPISAEPTIEFDPAAAATGRAEAHSLGLSVLRAACPTRQVEVDDPYHGRRVGYYALALRCVLDLGFARVGGAEGLSGQGLLLVARDGYRRPASGEALLESGAWLAYGEVAEMDGPDALPRFTPIDRRKLDPAPFYMVWTEAGQNDPHRHPWPYQLVRIEIAAFREAFPKTVPDGLDASHAGWVGYGIFERACASCHAINGEGGKIGPDLNVPRSIVEYRPVDQIKDYIRDPEATRYTSMPAHPDLSEADLDALIDYFRAMSERKRDPRAGRATVDE